MKLSIIPVSFIALLAFSAASAIVPTGTVTTPPPSTNGVGTPPPVTDQDRQAGCNASATRQHLTGDALKKFMDSCMKRS